MRSMATRPAYGKRSRPMDASTSWRSQPTPVCGASDPRSRQHKSKPEDDRGARDDWLKALHRLAWSPRWSQACPAMPGNAWRWSREKKGQSNIAGHEHASWKVAISFLGLISGSSRVAREVDPKQIAYYLAYAPAK